MWLNYLRSSKNSWNISQKRQFLSEKGSTQREWKSSQLLKPNPWSLRITSVQHNLLHISSIIPLPCREHFLTNRPCRSLCSFKQGVKIMVYIYCAPEFRRTYSTSTSSLCPLSFIFSFESDIFILLLNKPFLVPRSAEIIKINKKIMERKDKYYTLK